MKPSELRDKNNQELAELEKQLRGRLLKLRIGKASSKLLNTAQFKTLRRDIARIKTIQKERGK